MIDKITPQKLDSSLDLKLTKKNSMVDALNVMITESEFTGDSGDASGDSGVLRNIKGNRAASYRFPWDVINRECTSKVIGSVVDDKTKIIYFFLWSSCNKENSVYAYDLYGKLPHGQPNTIRLIYKGGNLQFRQNDFIKADVVHINRPTLDVHANEYEEFNTDAIIYFTDNRNEPRKINAYRNLFGIYYRAISGDLSDTLVVYGGAGGDYTTLAAEASAAYSEVADGVFSSQGELYSNIWQYQEGSAERRKLISACTTVPLSPIETVTFENDLSYTGSNFKSTAGLQFAYQLVYKDGNESAISPYSRIFVPPVIIGQGANTIVDHSQNNKCVINIPQDHDREAQYIKILVREGENSSFLLIDEVVSDQSSSNWTHSSGQYVFYNDRILTGVSEEEVNKTFDNVPKKAQAQTVEENRLIYGNYVEGFGNVSASAQITPVTSGVNQPVLRQVKVVPSMSQVDPSNDPGVSNPITAGFILDFSEIDSLEFDDVVSFSMSISPDRNFHVGYYSRVAPFNKNLSVSNYIDESDQYTSFAFYDNDGLADQNRINATNIWGGFNATGFGLGNDLVYTSYDATGNATVYSNPKVGSGYLNPIIVKGGTLVFSVSFKYTGPLLLNTSAAEYLGPVIRKFLTGVYDANNPPENIFAEDIQVSNKFTHSYDLQLNNFDTLQAGYPNIGLQAGQGEGSTVYPQSSAPDYRTFLINCIGEPGIFPQGNTSSGIPPIGYFILNKAKADFSLIDGDTITSNSIQEVKLEITKLYDLDIATCIRRPSMFAPWVVLTSSFWTGDANADWDSYSTNSVVENNSDTEFWYIGDYEFDEAELADVIGDGEAFPRAGEYLYNFTKQFGRLTFLEEDTPAIASGDFYIYDGEAGAGGYNGTDEYNSAEISKCGSVPMYIGFVEENDRVSYNLATGNTDPTYKYFIGGTFFNGKPSMVGYNVAQNHLLLIDGPGGGYENQLSFAPAMKGPASIPIQAAQENDNSLVYYSVNDYDVSLLHPDIEILTSNFMSSSYNEPYKSFKSSSKHDFGVVYFDRYGRHGFVNPIGSVYAPGYSDQERADGGKGKISMLISMQNNPPSWATRWKVVHSKSVTVDRFIQYSVGGAYVKVGEAEEDNERNIYVSLNYLQGSNVSYVSSFGARTPEGGLNMYKYEKGDRLRVVSYQNISGELTYPSNYDFEVIDMVNLGDDQNPLYEADSNPDQWLKGDFVVLRNDLNYPNFDYTSIKNGGHFWGNNCIVELYKPSRNTDGSKRFYYEIGETFNVLTPQALFNLGVDDTPLNRHEGQKKIDDGDVYWRPVAVNFRDIDDGSFTDIIVNTEDDAGVNLSKSNFKSYFLESMTSTDLLRGDAIGLGRVHTVFKDATESRRMASLTYSLPTNPLSKRNYYGSFNGSTLNFKDLPEKYGYINYILNRGDSILVLQDDKVSVVPMLRNVIEQTDGSSLVVSSKDVFGKVRFYAGDVGADGHPESVVRAEESVYFVHGSSGRVFRFTESGITDITNYGMLSRIREELRRVGGDSGTDAVKIISGYDPLNEEYLLTISNGTNYAESFTNFDDFDINVSVGCIDSSACNYNPEADLSDGSCVYAGEFLDCDGNCLNDSDGDGICDELEIEGCTDPLAANYNPATTDENNSICQYEGCTDPGACNYNETASIPDGSCDYESCAGCTDETADNYDPDATIENYTCEYYGCTDITACNYNSQANVDDGFACTYAEQYYDCDGNCLNDSDGDGICDELEVPGCTDPTACNYNLLATDDNGSCIFAEEFYDCDGNCLNDFNGDGICDENDVSGCTYPPADNYNPEATVDDGSCTLTINSCTNELACNYGGPWNDPASGAFTYVIIDDGSCNVPSGPCDVCQGSEVVTLDADGDGVCDGDEIFGCTDPQACNYDPTATEDNNNCNFITCAGCMDVTACNYDPSATIPANEQCTYPELEYLDCDGNCLNDSDGDGVCDEDEKPGCADPLACNYDPAATDDDGSCVFVTDACQECQNGEIVVIPDCCYFDYDSGTIIDFVETFGLTYLEMIWLLSTTALVMEDVSSFRGFLKQQAFDQNLDGTIGTPDLLDFLSDFGSLFFEVSFQNLASNYAIEKSNSNSCVRPLFEPACLIKRGFWANNQYFLPSGYTPEPTPVVGFLQESLEPVLILLGAAGAPTQIAIASHGAYIQDLVNKTIVDFIAYKELSPYEALSQIITYNGDTRALAILFEAILNPNINPDLYIDENQTVKLNTSVLLNFLTVFDINVDTLAGETYGVADCPINTSVIT